MAKLYIAEFSNPGLTSYGAALPMVKAPPLVEQTIAISGASAQSAAFAGTTDIIRVHSDAICSVLVGPNPTATTSTMRLAADQTEYFVVNPGDKIAVIANT